MSALNSKTREARPCLWPAETPATGSGLYRDLSREKRVSRRILVRTRSGRTFSRGSIAFITGANALPVQAWVFPHRADSVPGGQKPFRLFCAWFSSRKRILSFTQCHGVPAQHSQISQNSTDRPGTCFLCVGARRKKTAQTACRFLILPRGMDEVNSARRHFGRNMPPCSQA